MKRIIQTLMATLALTAWTAMGQGPGAPRGQNAPPDSGSDASTMMVVDATGSGVTEDEAFRQAVVDAVRQVVGTLVSAESVVSNDKVIKDQVLTLSKGFVEKVLSREKSKQADGTWEVKLKCIVRKGQVYSTLKTANVPLVKVDGDSMFADVVSQLNFRREARKILSEAMREFLRAYPSVYRYECSKPVVSHAGEEKTAVKMTYRCKFDGAQYYKVVLPPLRGALKRASKESFGLAKGAKPHEYGELRKSEQKLEERGEVMVALEEPSTWSVYGIEKEILQGCDLREAFRGPIVGGSASFIVFEGSEADNPLFIYRVESCLERGRPWVAAHIEKGEENTDVEFEIPTSLLQNISKATMRMGLNVSGVLASQPQGSGAVAPRKDDFAGYFDEEGRTPFCSEGWLVYPEGNELAAQKGIPDAAATVAQARKKRRNNRFGGNVYYLGETLEYVGTKSTPPPPPPPPDDGRGGAGTPPADDPVVLNGMRFWLVEVQQMDRNPKMRSKQLVQDERAKIDRYATAHRVSAARNSQSGTILNQIHAILDRMQK